MPGIADADLKAMQKPPMRSFDPAILQETGKGRRGQERMGEERIGEDRMEWERIGEDTRRSGALRKGEDFIRFCCLFAVRHSLIHSSRSHEESEDHVLNPEGRKCMEM